MTDEDPRVALDRLCRERGEDYASLSTLIGRNPAYVQQFIRRGVPRRLGESDRRRLADYFNVPETVLGGPERGSPAVTAVPRLDLAASAGPGRTGEALGPESVLQFDQVWLRRLGVSAAALSVIRVAGDSMLPMLADGDEILVDRDAATRPLHDGIYVLRRDEALLVKRIALEPGGPTVSVRSDNRAYPSWDGCDPASLAIVGRVVWAGRRIS